MVVFSSFLQQLKSNTTTMLDFLMHEMATILTETMEDMVEAAKQGPTL
jgi:hypothetical protein